jgi:hypothetical protein
MALLRTLLTFIVKEIEKVSRKTTRLWVGTEEKSKEVDFEAGVFKWPLRSHPQVWIIIIPS